jgi:hypothetical protein
MRRAASTAASMLLLFWPPSLKLSGVIFKIPMMWVVWPNSQI